MISPRADERRRIFQTELEATRNLDMALLAVERAALAEAEDRLRRERERLDAERRRLGGFRGPPTQKALSEMDIDRVLEAAAKWGHVSVRLMLHGSSQPCRHARWVAAVMLRTAGMSLPQVAVALSMTDHTAALYGERRVHANADLLAAAKGLYADLFPSQRLTEAA